MRLLRLLAVALALWPAAAGAQGVLQNGPTANGHVPMYVGQGGQAVVQDSGPAGGGIQGYGLSELLIAARGTGLPPYAGQGTGPLGTNACDYDGPLNSAAGYHYICLSANAQGGGLITYGAGGGAADLPLNVIVNGATIPFGGQLLVGPGQIAANYAAGTNQVIANNWMASGAACPAWLSPYQLFANTTAAPTGTLLTVWDGTQCVTVGTLNETTHAFSVPTPITIGSTVIISGTDKGLLYDNAGVVGNLATGNNGALITSGAGVPSISSTLPGAVQANITGTGTLTSGATGAGFTIDLGASTISGVLGSANGGTGVNNGAKTITVNTSSVAFTPGVAGQIGVWSAGTLSGSATPTLGASGTLGSITMGNATSGLLTLRPQTGALGAVTVSLPAATTQLVGRDTTDTLTNKSIDGSEITSGVVGASVGGTGVNNGAKTITILSASVQIVSSSSGMGCWQSGQLTSCAMPAVNFAPSNPSGTASATQVMMGLGATAAITPIQMGRASITISGDIFNAGGVGDGATYGIRYGTGAAPANGVAVTGSVCGAISVKYISSTTAGKVPFSVTCVATGLTINSAYWIDLALSATTAGTAVVNDITIAALEM